MAKHPEDTAIHDCVIISIIVLLIIVLYMGTCGAFSGIGQHLFGNTFSGMNK